MIWCQHIGHKLRDDSISTDKIIEQVIIPETINERPKLIPLIIEWPPDFLKRSEDVITVEIGEKTYPFYQVALEISTRTNTGPLRFRVTVDDTSVEYEVVFEEHQVEYVPIGETTVYLSVLDRPGTLSDWFEQESPIITFTDSSQLEYNELSKPKNESEREPYAVSKIKSRTWSGVVLSRESQYRAHRNPPRLEFRQDSIQRHMIEYLLWAEDLPDYDIIFDDDGNGEIADIVALKVAGDNLLVHLFHCKYSRSDKTGAREGNFFEVCGQAQKSVRWRNQKISIFEHLKLRHLKRWDTYNVSRFAKGDLEKLDELRRRSRDLLPKFHVFIIQPGLDVQRVDNGILDLLGATELYLRETCDAPLAVICSGNSTKQ